MISQQGQPLGLRARFALERMAALAKDGPVKVEDLQRMVMDDQVYLADQVMPDLLGVCAGDLGPDASALVEVCASLKAWDRTAGLKSGLGFVHFQHIMDEVRAAPGSWRVAFDPKDPQHTPRGLAIERPPVLKAVREAMLASVKAVKAAGLSKDSQWQDVQVSSSGGRQTPIHGGPGELGIYNAIQSVPGANGKREVVSGTSYLQVVTFDGKGPQAQGLLAFSISSDPASPYSADQTQAFSQKQWSVLPFTEQQIKADPHYQALIIRERDEAGRVATQ